MSRKSIVSAKLALGVSTFAIAGAICWIAGTDDVQAGSLRMKSGFARAGVPKVSGLKQTTRINSRAIRRFAVPKKAFQANRRLRVPPLNKTTVARKFKSVAPVRGSQRLTIGHANRIRLQTLNTANRTRKFGRIVNIGSVSSYKDIRISQKTMTGYVKVPDIVGESKRGKDGDKAKNPLWPAGAQIAPSQPPVKVSPSKVRGVFSKKLLMTGLSNEAKLKGGQKFPKITLDNGIRFGAAPEFETGASVAPQIGKAIGALTSDNNDVASWIGYRPQFFFSTTDVTGAAATRKKFPKWHKQPCWSCSMTVLALIPSDPRPVKNFFNNGDAQPIGAKSLAWTDENHDARLAVTYAIFRLGVRPLTSTEQPATPADVFFDNSLSGSFFGKYRRVVANVDDPLNSQPVKREIWTAQKSVRHRALISTNRTDNFGAARGSDESAGKRQILKGMPVTKLSLEPKNASFPEDGVCEPREPQPNCCGC